ncbi:MAG: hypothetical protein AAF772_01535, partial [Acidobacteriota bacterium]
MSDMSVDSASNSVDTGAEEAGFDAGLNETTADAVTAETAADVAAETAADAVVTDTFETAAPDSPFAGAAATEVAAPADDVLAANAAPAAEPPDPQAIIDAHKNGLFNLNLDEEGLGQTLANDYALNGDYDTVTAVIDELAGHNQDDVARAFVDALSDDQLAQIASTDAGLELVKDLRDPLTSGWVSNADEAANARLETAFYSNEGHFQEITDRAALSADVYNDSGAPEGWTRLNDAGLPPELEGLTWNDEGPGGSGFNAALYQSDTGEVTLVFEGSGDAADWSNNIRQGLGLESRQYNQAIELAQQVHNVYGDDLTITGHSLG